MKLIYCRTCRDVVKLIDTKWRICSCGMSGGQYNEDQITATIGGHCDIIGIPNPFFDDVFKHLSDPHGKEWYRRKNGWNTTDCWYGEYPGDKQVFRIKSPFGPPLKMRISKCNKNDILLTIIDDRSYKCALLDDPKTIVIEDCWDYYKKATKAKPTKQTQIKSQKSKQEKKDETEHPHRNQSRRGGKRLPTSG